MKRMMKLDELSLTPVLILLLLYFAAVLFSSHLLFESLVYYRRKMTALSALGCTAGAYILCIPLQYYICSRFSGEGIAGSPVFFKYIGSFRVIAVLLPPVLIVLAALTMLYYNRQWAGAHISLASMKEAADSLPTGICFCSDAGNIYLMNRQMQHIFERASGNSLLDSKQLSAFLEKHGDRPLVLDEDSVWQFDISRLNDDVSRITASDITELYHAKRQLDSDHARLSAMNTRLLNYNNTLDETIRMEELVNTQIRIHDHMGRILLETKAFLAGNHPEMTGSFLAEDWKETLTVLRGASEITSEGSPQEDILQAGRLIGIDIVFRGTFPTAPDAVRLLTIGARECMTNAAKHGAATVMYISSEISEGCLRIEYTNNGNAPDAEITEGNGLRNLRTKVERAGAVMKLISTPGFALILEIPLEMEEQACSTACWS